MASIDLTPGPACRVIISLPTIGQKAKATDLSSPLVGNPDFGAMSNLAANIRHNPEQGGEVAVTDFLSVIFDPRSLGKCGRWKGGQW